MAIPTYDLYAVLGVPMDADRATIRRAYRRLIREIHPDRHPEHERAGLHERAAKVNAAWEYLSDPVKRRDYNATNGFTTVPPRPPQPKPPPPRSHQTAPPPPPPPRTPPPPRPRQVIQTSDAIDFGTVTVGHSATSQMVWLSFVGGSRVRHVQLNREAGLFWRAVIERAEDERSVRIYFFHGLPIPLTTPSGRQVDHVYVQLDEASVDIALSVTVQSAPQPRTRIPDPPPSRPPPPPPRRPATPPPPPNYTAAPRPRRSGGKGKRVLAGMALMLAAVLLGPKVWHHFESHAPVEPSPKASGEYCSIATNHGQMLWFYRTKPGTTERASQDSTWVIMVPHRGDPYLSWWTPQFPYWERGNTSDGLADPTLQYFEVLAVKGEGWTPLTDVFADYPNLFGGPAAEKAGRQSFVTKWHAQQGSPRCS